LFLRPINDLRTAAQQFFRRVKGFGDVTVGALLLSPIAIAGGVLGGHQDHGMALNSALFFSSRQIENRCGRALPRPRRMMLGRSAVIKFLDALSDR